MSPPEPSFSPTEIRQRKREDIENVVAEFEAAQNLLRRWTAWLDDDSCWPSFSTVTHGEVYPAHQLMDGPVNLSILDRTTAAIGDPARDFMFHHASVSASAFENTTARYVEAGAVRSADPEHMSAARFRLNPEN